MSNAQKIYESIKAGNTAETVQIIESTLSESAVPILVAAKSKAAESFGLKLKEEKEEYSDDKEDDSEDDSEDDEKDDKDSKEKE